MDFSEKKLKVQAGVSDQLPVAVLLGIDITLSCQSFWATKGPVKRGIYLFMTRSQNQQSRQDAETCDETLQKSMNKLVNLRRHGIKLKFHNYKPDRANLIKAVTGSGITLQVKYLFRDLMKENLRNHSNERVISSGLTL